MLSKLRFTPLDGTRAVESMNPFHRAETCSIEMSVMQTSAPDDDSVYPVDASVRQVGRSRSLDLFSLTHALTLHVYSPKHLLYLPPEYTHGEFTQIHS